MNIGIQVFGEFKEYVKSSDGGKITFDIPEETNIETLLEKLGISSENAGVVLVNGKFASRDLELSQDDQVQIIPILEGG